MPELFQDYWEAVARVRSAAKELDQAAAAIRMQSPNLVAWREPSGPIIDLEDWPSADKLRALLNSYWEARHLLTKMYKRFPADQQQALQSPDAIDTPSK